MKKLVVILTLALACAFNSNAQSQDNFNPGWKMSVLGGINYVTSDQWALAFFKHVTPNAQFGMEYSIVPWFSVRGTLGAPMGTYPVEGTKIGKFGYLQLGADAMFDFANMFGYKSTRALNPYLFLGLAGYGRFAANDVKAHIGTGLRGGLGVKVRLGESLKLVMEVQENAVGNAFNTLKDNKQFGAGKGRYRRAIPWDDNLAALAGLQFDLGAGKRRQAEAEAAERRDAAQAAAAAAAQATAERLAAARAAAEEAYAQRLAAQRAALEISNPSMAEERITFDAYSIAIPEGENSKLNHIISVLKQYPSTKVTINGFSQRSPAGTPSLIESLERAEIVRLALSKAGIAENRIVTNYYGDRALLPASANPALYILCQVR